MCAVSKKGLPFSDIKSCESISHSFYAEMLGIVHCYHHQAIITKLTIYILAWRWLYSVHTEERYANQQTFCASQGKPSRTQCCCSSSCSSWDNQLILSYLTLRHLTSNKPNRRLCQTSDAIFNFFVETQQFLFKKFNSLQKFINFPKLKKC